MADRIIICCFTDLACCLTLIFERAEYDLLSLPPRDPKDSRLVNAKLYLQSYGFIGVMEVICAHAMFFWFWAQKGVPISGMFFAFSNFGDGFYGYTAAELNAFLSTGQSILFVTLVVLQISNLNSVRNTRVSILQRGPQHNKWLICGPIFSIATAVFVTEVPWFNRVMGTAPVPVKYWFIPIPLGIGIIAMDEIRKLLVRTFPNGPIAKVAL